MAKNNKENDSVDEILKEVKERRDSSEDSLMGIFDSVEVDEDEEMSGFADRITYSGMSVFDEFDGRDSAEEPEMPEDTSDPTYNVSVDELFKLMESFSDTPAKNTDSEVQEDESAAPVEEKSEEQAEETATSSEEAAESVSQTAQTDKKDNSKKDKKSRKKAQKKSAHEAAKKKEKELLTDIFEMEASRKAQKEEKPTEKPQEEQPKDESQKVAEAYPATENPEEKQAETDSGNSDGLNDVFAELLKMQSSEKQFFERKAAMPLPSVDKDADIEENSAEEAADDETADVSENAAEEASDNGGKTKVFTPAGSEAKPYEDYSDDSVSSESDRNLEAECDMNRKEKIENFRILAEKISESETYGYEEQQAPEKISSVKSGIGEDIFSAIEKFVPKKENAKKQERKKERESRVYEKIDVGRVRIRLNEAFRSINISLILTVISAVMCLALEILRLIYIRSAPAFLGFMGERSVIFFALAAASGLPMAAAAVIAFISRLKNSEGFCINNEVFLLLVTVLNLAHTAVLCTSGEPVGKNTILYGLSVSLIVLAGILADKKETKMILGNLDTLTKNEKILGVFPLDKDTVRFAEGVSPDGEPTVLCPGEVEIPDSFLDSSFIRDKQNSFFSFAVPAVVLLSILCAVVSAVTYGGIVCFSTAFMSTLLISSPTFVTLVLVSAISEANSGLNSIGCEILGYEAVEYVEDIDAVVLDSASIFNGKISNFRLIDSAGGIGTLRAFETACSVLSASRSILSADVNELVQEQSLSLPKIDSLIYEDRLGLSCWMGNSRVLLGNLKMMQEHNVEIPAEYSGEVYEAEGKRVFFLSVDGAATATFCAEYYIGRRTKELLKKLCTTGAILMLITEDPNIDEVFVADTLEVSADSVKPVPPSAANRIRDSLEHNSKQKRTGLIFKNSISGLLRIINSAFRLYDIQSLTLLLQTVSMVFAFVLVCVLNVAATEYFASAGIIIIYHLIWTVLSHILSKKK